MDCPTNHLLVESKSIDPSEEVISASYCCDRSNRQTIVRSSAAVEKDNILVALEGISEESSRASQYSKSTHEKVVERQNYQYCKPRCGSLQRYSILIIVVFAGSTQKQKASAYVRPMSERVRMSMSGVRLKRVRFLSTRSGQTRPYVFLPHVSCRAKKTRK